MDQRERGGGQLDKGSSSRPTDRERDRQRGSYECERDAVGRRDMGREAEESEKHKLIHLATEVKTELNSFFAPDS